jgi:hypothetical protein
MIDNVIRDWYDNKPALKSIRRYLEKDMMAEKNRRERLYHANDLILYVIKKYEREKNG